MRCAPILFHWTNRQHDALYTREVDDRYSRFKLTHHIFHNIFHHILLLLLLSADEEIMHDGSIVVNTVQQQVTALCLRCIYSLLSVTLCRLSINETLLLMMSIECECRVRYAWLCSIISFAYSVVLYIKLFDINKWDMRTGYTCMQHAYVMRI